jgi:hypothetical protein
MKSEIITAEELAKNCTAKDRILLVNPPVVETRYQWLKWNQPLDLLKMGSFLKQRVGCEVKLYDFMFPTGGKVTRTVNQAQKELVINERSYSYTLWRYGESNEKFKEWCDKLRAGGWHPTQVWVTSLTSYWWLGVTSTITLIKSVFNAAKIILYGQYPVYETDHAQENSCADAVVKNKIGLTDYRADFSLYDKRRPAFCGLDARSTNWADEVVEKSSLGVADFAFFNDDILAPEADVFGQLGILQKQLKTKSNRPLKFHGICGLLPSRFTEEAAKKMLEAGFAELHFEEQLDGLELDLDAYKRAREAYRRAGFQLGPNELSGFLFIGTPRDGLERIIRQMINLLEIWGTVILKPYGPTPGSPDYENHEHLFKVEDIERLSPHAFPFASVNGIAHEDYDELYILAAALNQKVKGRSFNSFPGTLAFEMIKTSLEREVWKLGYEESASH